MLDFLRENLLRKKVLRKKVLRENLLRKGSPFNPLQTFLRKKVLSNSKYHFSLPRGVRVNCSQAKSRVRSKIMPLEQYLAYRSSLVAPAATVHATLSLPFTTWHCYLKFSKTQKIFLRMQILRRYAYRKLHHTR